MFEQAEKGGAVHINCPFPEPLYGSESKGIFQAYLDEVKSWSHSDKPYSCKVRTQSLPALHYADLADKPGVIVVGSVTLEEAQQAKLLADKLAGHAYVIRNREFRLLSDIMIFGCRTRLRKKC